jgi:hypothetical protein
MKFKSKMKSCLKSILKINLLLITFFVVSCSDDSEKKEEEVVTPEFDLASQISSFEIPISGTAPNTIAEIANSAYNSPASPYGMTSVIDFVVNADNTIAILYSGKDRTKHLVQVSLTNKSISKEFVIPARANSGRFLGFDSLGNDKFIIGYSADNSFGDKDAEAWYVAFEGSTGKEIFATRIFGEVNLADISSKGNAGDAGSSLVKYNAKDNVVAIYTAHTQRWPDNVRHQGGWVGFLDGTTGKILTKGSDNDIIGDTWFYSHNFDQRGMFSKEGKFYVLAHGDAYPRALGFAKFSSTNGKEGELEYYKIKNGAVGDNTTNATTGDFEELSDGNVAIVYSTSDDRANRDLKLVILNSLTSKTPAVSNEVWVTKNEGTQFVGWGSKVVQFGDKILLGWNTFEGKKPINTKFCLADLQGKLIGAPVVLPNAVLYPTQSMKKTADNKNAVFVSFNSQNKLQVHVIAAK